jgi:hypothetical protein
MPHSWCSSLIDSQGWRLAFAAKEGRCRGDGPLPTTFILRARGIGLKPAHAADIRNRVVRGSPRILLRATPNGHDGQPSFGPLRLRSSNQGGRTYAPVVL